MGRIKFCGVGVNEHVLARLDRLRACLGESRSRVLERALVAGGLPGLEREFSSEVARFSALAEQIGVSWEEFAQAYSVIYARQTYPPKVAELEKLGIPSVREAFTKAAAVSA